MLVWLMEQLTQYHTGFNVFQYITLRTILSVVTALFLALFLGPLIINYLIKSQANQAIRTDGPESHLAKTGTPTMGGALILLSLVLTTLLWANLDNRFIWLVLFVTAAFGVIGFIDDYQKILRGNPRGLPARWKYLIQSIVGLMVVWVLYDSAQVAAETTLILPFIKDFAFELGWLYLVLGYFVIVGTSNAVNLTDGLDGLAIMPTVMLAAALAIFAYLSGHSAFSEYLSIPHVPGVGELTVFCGALVGAGLGFLWFNTYPAQVFMGDTGSLALGAALGLVAVMVRQEVVFFIMAGVFVMETVSVILQVGSYKLTGRRIFKMAPLHHHFELKGWPEPRVIVRFWIITVVLVMFGLATLKIR